MLSGLILGYLLLGFVTFFHYHRLSRLDQKPPSHAEVKKQFLFILVFWWVFLAYEMFKLYLKGTKWIGENMFGAFYYDDD